MAEYRVKLKGLVFTCALIILFARGYSLAEIITLKSGKTIEGKILEKTGDYIKLDSQGKIIFYENKYIKGIEESPQAAVDSAPRQVPVSSSEGLLKAGLKLAWEGKFDLAQSQFDKVLEINKDDHNALSAKDLLAEFKAGKISEDLIKYLFQGSYNMIEENYPAAIAGLKKAESLSPDDLDIAYNLGVAYYSINEFDKAIDYLKKVVNNRPKDGLAYSYLGSTYLSLGKLQEAESNFTEAKKLFDETGDTENASEMKKILAKILLISFPRN